MGLRDAAMTIVILSAIEAYGVITFAPQLRPVGGLGRLAERLFLINIVLYGIYAIFVYPNFLSPLRKIPGPKPDSIVLGNMIRARMSSPRGDAMRQWMEDIPNEGLIHLKDAFNSDAVIPTSHETLKTILSDNPYDYEKQERVVAVLRRILGDGLILVEGNVHKFQRKHLLPSFQVKVIRDLYPVYWQKACELTQMLKGDTSKNEIEFGIWCTRVTLDIIGIAGFGQDFNSLKNPEDDFVAQYNEILEPDKSKALFFALNIIFPHWIAGNIPFWEIPKRLARISKNLYTFALNLSKERRAYLHNRKINSEEKDAKNDILSLLVKSNDFTDHELAHQVLTMMAAGHETTSSTLSWCVYLLAQNQQLQTKVRQEIRASLPSPNDMATKTITAAQIDALPWLNAVCNETTRLYPTVPVTTRQVVKKTPLGGYQLPVGTTVYLSPWAINRSSHFWGPTAQEFKPERWINSDGTPNNTGGVKSNYSILTFLHGPRSCIGQGFAKSELKCLLAAVIGRYEFTITRPEKDYYPAGLVTSKPANGMWVGIKEIEGW